MKKTFITLLGLAAMVTSANAANLANGANQAPTVFGSSVLTGTTLVASANGTFTASTFTGTYTENVYRDPANEFCPNCLDFTYMFTNNASSNDALGRFTAGFVAGLMVDVGYISGTGAAPVGVDRSATGSPVAWDYNTGGVNIMPGHSTATLIFETNATTFGPGATSAQDNFSANGVPIGPGPYGPTSTPEPVTMSLLGGGLALIGLARLRHKAHK